MNKHPLQSSAPNAARTKKPSNARTIFTTICITIVVAGHLSYRLGRETPSERKTEAANAVLAYLEERDRQEAFDQQFSQSQTDWGKASLGRPSSSFKTSLRMRDWTAEPLKEPTRISARAARKLVWEKTDMEIIDLRSRKAFEKGHVPEAVNHPAETTNIWAQLLLLESEIPWLIYCEEGTKSEEAFAQIAKYGPTKVYLVEGGYQAWSKARFPGE